MTQPPSDLEELRLLREAPLAPGFEERLRERLISAATQDTVIQLGRRRRPYSWLLLAAIALPVAALAAGGVSVIGHWTTPKTPVATPSATKRAPESQQKSRGIPVAPPGPVAPKQESPEPQSTDEKGAYGGGAAAATKGLEPGKALRVSPSGASQLRPSGSPAGDGASQSSRGVGKVATEPRLGEQPAPVEKGPAHIESLELTVPRVPQSSKATEGAGASGKNSVLRGATDKSYREQVSSVQDTPLYRKNRDFADKQQGHEASERARERNQERLRKGQ